MRILLFLFLTGLVSCMQKGKVTIIKQWHLSPNALTTDVSKSETFAQFENQKAIYQFVKSKVSESGGVIIAEGCEGEISESYKEVFNGWSMKKLSKYSESDDFERIMAPVPMKIEAKFGKRVKTICGDNLEEIKQNNLAMSDLRGFAGFYQRLSSSMNNPVKFDKYKKSLEAIAGQEVKDPVEHTRLKALEALKRSRDLIESRNLSFLRAAKENLEDNPAIIIGGIHAQHLGELFEKEGIDYEIVSLEGYSSADTSLFETLEKALGKKEQKGKVVYMNVPFGFSSKSIPLENLLDKNDIADELEWKHLVSMMEEFGLDERILLSDNDKDGIRDFTVSSQGALLVVAAEDDDWDNDGVFNLADTKWGPQTFPDRVVTSEQVGNRFDIQGINAGDLIKKLSKRGIQVLNHTGESFDLLLLKVVTDALERMKLDNEKLRFLRQSKPAIKYGKEVYFSYNPATLTVDIHMEELMAHFKWVHEKHYPKNSQEDVLKGYLLPLLYHSVSHELGHAINPPNRTIAMEDGWSFKTREYKGKYLVKYRLTRKIINDTLDEVSFKGQNPTQFLRKGKSNPGFLVSEGIPSLYSLSKPSEWVAEKIAMCFLRAVYPDSSQEKVAKQYEALLGVNPLAVTRDFCQAYIRP